MIPCPKFGERTAVINTRVTDEIVRRRRKCFCGHKFSTLERPVGTRRRLKKILENEIGEARAHAERLRAIAEELDKFAEAADA